MLLIKDAKSLPTGVYSWHTGTPLPPLTGNVIQFVADGDELGLILWALALSAAKSFRPDPGTFWVYKNKVGLPAQWDGTRWVLDAEAARLVLRLQSDTLPAMSTKQTSITYTSAQALLAAAALLGYNNTNAEAQLHQGKGALKLNARNGGDPDTPAQSKRWFAEGLTPVEKPVFDFESAQDAIWQIQGQSTVTFDMNAESSVLVKLLNVAGLVDQPFNLVFTMDTLLDVEGAPAKDLSDILTKAFRAGVAPGASWNPAV